MHEDPIHKQRICINKQRWVYAVRVPIGFRLIISTWANMAAVSVIHEKLGRVYTFLLENNYWVHALAACTLIHWGRVSDACIYAYENYIIIGSDICLSHSRCQSIIWTNAAIMLIGLLVSHITAPGLLHYSTFDPKPFNSQISRHFVCLQPGIIGQCILFSTSYMINLLKAVIYEME